MKKILLGLCFVFVCSTASAFDVKTVGYIDKITVNSDHVVVIIKNHALETRTEIIVKDQLTIDKFKDKRLFIGDEIRVKFDDKTKITTMLRKTAGC